MDIYHYQIKALEPVVTHDNYLVELSIVVRYFHMTLLQELHILTLINKPTFALIRFCCSGRIPRLSLNQHSLYVRVVEKPPPPPLTGEQYGKVEPKYPEGGHCQSVLRPMEGFNVPLYFK